MNLKNKKIWLKWKKSDFFCKNHDFFQPWSAASSPSYSCHCAAAAIIYSQETEEQIDFLISTVLSYLLNTDCREKQKDIFYMLLKL